MLHSPWRSGKRFRAQRVCARPFGALLNVELDPLALVQYVEAYILDGREMDEHIRAGVAGDKAKSPSLIEPFDGSCLSCSHFAAPL